MVPKGETIIFLSCDGSVEAVMLDDSFDLQWMNETAIPSMTINLVMLLTISLKIIRVEDIKKVGTDSSI